jgi:cytochrome c-type biogenesis protein CcmF
MVVLQIGLLTDDFSVRYIANNSAVSTPLPFKVASAWAALEGSIVLWGLVLGGFAFTVWLRFRSRPADPLWSGALAVIGIVSLFFFGLMLTVSNPFRVCTEAASIGCAASSNLPWAASQAPLDGFGPNALLQNHILMAVHPPMLYLGYVGMTVPFGFAIAALVIGRGGDAWLRASRTWTLVAWTFLTAGIVLGGLWSYEVLGWGGYWAWDPVENASFIPWLVATAFIHSSVVQMRRGMLQSWNFILVIATFATTILGTFLTRSGVIQSVHAFTQSAIGPALLWFLALVLVVSLALFSSRARLVGSSKRLDSLASREGVFLVNNLLLTVFAFAVIAGTLYPMFVEAISGDQVGVGRPFYDRIALPLGLGLLLAMAVGPVTPYRTASWSVVWERLRTPMRVALGVGAAAVLLGARGPLLVLAVVLGAFVWSATLRQWGVTAAAVAAKTSASRLGALGRVVHNDPHYWGGQLSHLGIALLAVGIALSAGQTVERSVVLQPGETARVAGFELTYDEPFSRTEPGRVSFGAGVTITTPWDSTSGLEPRLNEYRAQGQVVATPAVMTSLRGDLYLSLDRIDAESMAMTVYWFPFIWLIWAGGFLAAAATSVAYIAPRLGAGRQRASVGKESR